MDAYIGNTQYNDYRIGNETIKKLYKGETLIWEKTVTPTGTGYTEVWLPLSSITNYQAFNAIAWGTGYSPSRMDCWVSEIPGVVSDNMGWFDGITDETGWFATHRWNDEQYSLTFDHINYGWDNPDVEYGVSVQDNYRSYLGETTISVCGQTEHVYMTEFHDWTYWKPCYGAFSGASYNYGGKVFGRVQLPTQLWYTTTNEQPFYGIRSMSVYDDYSVDGGVFEVISGSPLTHIENFKSIRTNDSNIKTIIIPVGTVSGDITSQLFYNCTGLTSVVFPPTITDLPERMFSFCGQLKEIYLGCSAFPEHGFTYYGTYDNATDGTFYVPTGCDMTNFPSTGDFATWTVVYV